MTQTTYKAENGHESPAEVIQGKGHRRTDLRHRIARLHLDAINPDLAKAFDGPLWMGMDLSGSDDITAVWVMDSDGNASMAGAS